MKEETSLVHQDSVLPVPRSTLELLASAVRDPQVDPAKMRELFAIQKEIVAEERRVTFVAALTRVQALLPQFGKTAKVEVKGTVRSRYAPIEDIDTVVRPILAAEGLGVSYDVRPMDAKNILVVLIMSHRDGHVEESTLPLPIDFNEYRTGSQSTAASVTLGKRHLLKNKLNIVEKGADTDGNSFEKISPEQAADVNAKIEEVKANRPGFLKFMGVPRVEDILVRDIKKAFDALEVKRKQGEGK